MILTQKVLQWIALKEKIHYFLHLLTHMLIPNLFDLLSSAILT